MKRIDLVRCLGVWIAIAFQASSRLLPLAVASAYAQTSAPDQIIIAADWAVGDHTQIVVEKYRKKSGGTTSFEGRTETPARIEVLARLPDGYRLEWKWGQPRWLQRAQTPLFDEPGPAPMPIILKLSPAGKIIAIENWEEVRDATLKELEKSITTRGRIPPRLRPALALAREQMDTQQKTTWLLAKDMQWFFFVLGVDRPAGATVQTPEFSPNPFGGDPFPGWMRLTATRISDAPNRVRVRTDCTFDRDTASRNLRAALVQLDGAAASKPVAELQELTIDIEESADLTFDLAAGWLEEGTYRRTLQIRNGERSSMQQIDELIYRTPDSK